MTSPSTLNAEGVDTTALAREIERWLARPDRMARHLAELANLNPRYLWQLRRGKRPNCTLDWADRLAIAMDIPLDDIAPPPTPAPCNATQRAKRARHPQRRNGDTLTQPRPTARTHPPRRRNNPRIHATKPLHATSGTM